MRKLVFICIYLSLTIPAAAATLTVNWNGTGDYTTIQSAINAAVSGVDTVQVAPGTYYENINFNGKDIILRSTDPEDPNVIADTIIDGGGLDTVVRFSGSETSSCQLTGFTITNGTGAPLRSHTIGGGICGGFIPYNTHAAISNCIITGNIARYGGGLYRCGGAITNCTITDNTATFSGGGLIECDGAITNCVITGNQAVQSGGGLTGCNGSITNCTITDNSTIDGGGLYNCNGSITNCTIAGNTANSRGGGLHNCDGSITNCTITGNKTNSDGGGLYDCDASITNCTITNNTSTYSDGGGLNRCSGTITNCTITGNSADYWGGGLRWCNGSIINCIITDNSAATGGGLDRCDGSITNCTITDNTAIWGAGFYDCDGSITNCIIWGNTDNQLYKSSAPTYSCIQDWIVGGNGNINYNPNFSLSDDYHLTPGSPCIDAGNNNAVPINILTDIEGISRFIDDPYTIDTGKGTAPLVDMGAYEFIPSIEAAMKLTPQTLNCSSNGKWLKAHFVLPEGFSTEDVDTAKPATIDSLTCSSDHMNVSYNNEGLVEIEVAFPRNDFCSTGLFGNIELTVRGFFTDGTGFHGTDTIRITTNKFELLLDFSAYWLQADCTRPDFCNGFDLDHNGVVDLADFTLLAEN